MTPQHRFLGIAVGSVRAPAPTEMPLVLDRRGVLHAATVT